MDVFAQKILILSHEEGPQEFEIRVTVYEDGEIELRLLTRTITPGDDPPVQTDEWDTQFLPPKYGIGLRDFLNYAYPQEA